jgi:hypothetical protein
VKGSNVTERAVYACRKSYMNIYRQGDVLILSASNLPSDLSEIARDSGRIILAYGEVTGHSHAIADLEATLFSAPSTNDRFLRIMASAGADLVHEEHSTIHLSPGDYRIRIQREYSPDAIRNVAD